MQCDEDEACIKYWDKIDIKIIKDNKCINYYCSIFIDTLISFQKLLREECNIHTLLNCLRSLNLEGVEVKDEKEIEILNTVLS